MWTYHQSTAFLFRDGVFITNGGYSGCGAGKNNPAMEGVEGVGPVPRGTYRIGPAYHHALLGPLTMNLVPDGLTREYIQGIGRDPDSFRIHGDSAEHPGEASHGCIVQAHEIRMAIATTGYTTLEVME